MNYEGIKELLNAEDKGPAIKELKNGRKNSNPDVGPYKLDLDPKQHKVMDKLVRPDKIVREYQDDTIEDDGTISVNGDGSRVKNKVVPVERISLAMQRIIVERAVSFTFGNPLSVSADVEPESKDEEVLNAVKAVLRDAKTASKDRHIARDLFSCTEVAEMWYPVEKQNKAYGFDSKFKLRMAVISPLNGDMLFPYFDEYGDMIAFSRQYTVEQDDNKQHTFFETWTAEMHYKWELGTTAELCEGYPVTNTLGKIPVVYAQQQETEWAVVQNLIERLEFLLSNFADTNDYHASPKIFVTGTINGFAQKGESGAVIEGEEGASAQYLSWQQAPEAVKLEIETLLKMIYTLTQTPDISWDAVKGLNVSGVSLKLLFMDAHLKVKAKAEILDEYMQRRMSVIQAFLSQMNVMDAEFTAACRDLLIDVELVPYMINDEAATVNMLMAATGQKAVMSQRTAVQTLGWVNDASAEIQRINEESGMVNVSDLLAQEPQE